MSKKRKFKKLFLKKSNSINESTDFENESARDRYNKWNVNHKIGMSYQTFQELDSGIKDALEGRYGIPKRTKPEIRKLFKMAGD